LDDFETPPVTPRNNTASARLCFLETTVLNSDKIKTQFGSYGVEVLWQNETLRLANLYSVHGEARICRTLAVTHFMLPVNSALATSDQQIRAGQSIGATLRADGFTVYRSCSVLTHTTAGARFAAITGKSVPVGAALAVQIYSLGAARGGVTLDYAAIAEAYHPEHVSPDLTLPTLHDVLGQMERPRRLALSTLSDAL